MSAEMILQGAYDLHLHCGPDIIRRAQDFVEVGAVAHSMGLDGVLLKDHTTSTVDRSYALNQQYPHGPRFFSALVLNPPAGGLNPAAVEAALLAGVDVIFFPTYSARNHILRWGSGEIFKAFPLPDEDFSGITIFDEQGEFKPEVETILKHISAHGAVLATGHLSPKESLALIRVARELGINRMVVTHASQSVVDMSLDQQREARSMGAWIEHVFFSVTEHCPNPISLEGLVGQIRKLGAEHVILSSDFGQVVHGPPIEAFNEYLGRLLALGVPLDDIHNMIVNNPKQLIERKVNDNKHGILD